MRKFITEISKLLLFLFIAFIFTIITYKITGVVHEFVGVFYGAIAGFVWLENTDLI